MSKQYSRVKGTYTATQSEKYADNWEKDVKMYQDSIEWLQSSIDSGSKYAVEHAKILKRNQKKLAFLLANNPFTPVGE